MLTRHGWIITRGEHKIPQRLYGSAGNKLRAADDLLDITIFEDEQVALEAIKRAHVGLEYEVRRMKVTMEILDR